MLVHVLWTGLHAGWCDPGWCLSVQILRIPGKPSTFCYESIVCFPPLSLCLKEERLTKPNSPFALFFIFGNFSLSTSKVYGLFYQQRRAGPKLADKKE